MMDKTSSKSKKESSGRKSSRGGKDLSIEQFIIADALLSNLYNEDNKNLNISKAARAVIELLKDKNIVADQKQAQNRVQNLIKGLCDRSTTSDIKKTSNKLAVEEYKNTIDERKRDAVKLKSRDPKSKEAHTPPFGIALQEQCHIISVAYEKILEIMEGYCLTGTCDNIHIKIGAIETYCNYVMPSYIKVFHNEYYNTYPEIELTLLNGSSEEIRDWMKYYDINIAITTKREKYTGDLNYYEFINKEHPVYIYPSNISEESRSKLPFINLAHSTSWNDTIGKLKMRYSFINTDKLTKANGLQTIVNMVNQGLGTSVVPSTAVFSGNPDDSKLLSHLSNISTTIYDDFSLDIYLITRRDITGIELAFVNYLKRENNKVIRDIIIS